MSNQQNISDHLQQEKKDVEIIPCLIKTIWNIDRFRVLRILAIINLSIPLSLCDDNYTVNLFTFSPLHGVQALGVN